MLETDVEDVAVASVRFASGALASVDLNFFEAAYRRGCVVAGTEGTARWDWGTGRAVLARAGEEEEVVAVSEDVGQTYRAELEDFLEAVRDHRAPRAPLAAGAAAVELAEGLKESARRGTRVELS
jgi:predicted dehydrogenase